jgi:trans-aconitate methyltransferase
MAASAARANRPLARDVIADVGCGTGTQLRLVARACPLVTLIGIDPDAAIRERARAKPEGGPHDYVLDDFPVKPVHLSSLLTAGVE